jgi:hypothetical protein
MTFERWAFSGLAGIALVAACSNTSAPIADSPGHRREHDAGVDARDDAAKVADAQIETGVSDGGKPDGGPSHDAAVDADDGGPGASNPILEENELPGTSQWAIAQPSPNHEIEAYAGVTSAAPGDTVNVFASASKSTTFHWKLFRVGYYGGLGGRLVSEGGKLPIDKQADCPADPSTGLVECAWTTTFDVKVPPTWVTGQYLFKLIREDGFETYVPLIVREASRRAPFVVQASVTTWQAYNAWGGSSLYANELPSSVGFTAKHAYQVSFDRPYEYERLDNLESERGAGQHFYSERHFVEWVEREGYDVAYVTNVDVDADPELLTGRTFFASVGHDEYWSLGERHNVQKARDEGVSLGFFSGNAAYWRIRFDASAGGAPRRIMTCYKDRQLDPVHDAEDTTVRYREEPYSQPENALIGEMYTIFSVMDSFPLIAGNASHWVYEGTGVTDGETLSHVVGFEWDYAYRDENTPPGLEVVASSPTFSAYGASSESNVTVYYPTPTSLVFAAGTIQWAWGLGKPGYEDARIEKMTENVLRRAGLKPHTRTVVPRFPRPIDVGSAMSVTLVAGTGDPGHDDGDVDTAQFEDPAGVATDPTGNIYVAEAGNHQVRKITPDGTVSTLGGCGAEHPGRNGTCFDTPTGIAVGPDGLVYVSDTHNNRIRVIDPESGDVRIFAGVGVAGYLDGKRKNVEFAYPRGLAFGPDGSLYVADAGNSAIRKITGDDVTTVVLGTNEISGVAVGQDQTVYAIVSGNNQISMVQNGVLVPIANSTGTPGDQGGKGDSAELRPADGIVVAGTALIVADSANEKIRRIALTPDHTVTTLVGNGQCSSHVGNGAVTGLRNPRGIAVANGAYLVADSDNHRILRVVP